MTVVISLIAALGVGSIVASFISWFVAISNHRQNWINDLRDDISTFYKNLQMVHHAIGDEIGGTEHAIETQKARREARADLLFVYERLVLKLNIYEPLHVDLKARLDAHLADFSQTVPDPAKIKETTAVARRLLKREWAVVKFGPMAERITKWKGRDW